MIILVCFSALSYSQQAEKYIQEGNEFYRLQQYEKAAETYNKAINTDPQQLAAKFNLANTLQKQGKEDEAIQLFSDVAATAGEAALKSRANYNKGVILSQQKKLEESIEAYKNALRQNPTDKEARENLQKALLELKKKNPPKKKDDQQKKKQEQQKKQQQQPKISEKEAEQRLKLLEQKEKEVQQRLQKEKAKGGGSQTKDW